MPKTVLVKASLLYVIGRSLIRPVLRLRYRPKISGCHHVPASGPVLLVSNHLAALDPVFIPSFSPRQVRFLAKASLFNTPLRNWVMRNVGAVPVYREAGSAAQAALESGKTILSSGHVFAIFPEGSRSLTGKLHKGRTGAAWLALETGATVIPVGLTGTNRGRQKHSSLRMEMRFGPALDLSDLADFPRGAARHIATERIMTAIQSLTGQERSESFAEGGRGA